jgi:hypothetical protein
MQVVKLSKIEIVEAEAFGRGGQAHIKWVKWKGRNLLYKEYREAAPPVDHLERIAALGASRNGKEMPAAFPIARVVDDGTESTLGVLIEAAGPEFLLADGTPRHLKNLGKGPEYSDGHRLGVMGCYLRAMLRLHQAGFAVGDVKEANLLVADVSQGDPVRRILLVDCDSFVRLGLATAGDGYRTTGNLPEKYAGELDELTDFYQCILLTERILNRRFSRPATRSVWAGLKAKTNARQFEIAKSAKAFEKVNDAQWWELADEWSSMWSTNGVFEYQGGSKVRVSGPPTHASRSDGPPRTLARTKRARDLWARTFIVVALISGLVAFTRTAPLRSWVAGSINWLPSWFGTAAWWLLLLSASLLLLVLWWQWLKSGWLDCWGRPMPKDRWETADSRSAAVYLGYLLPACVVAVGWLGGHLLGSQVAGYGSGGSAAVAIEPIECTDPAFAANLEVALVGSVGGACSTTGVENLAPGTPLELSTWVLLSGTYAAANLQDASVTVTFGNSGDGGVVPLPSGLEVTLDGAGWAPYSPTTIDSSILRVDFPVDTASTRLAVRFAAIAVEPSNWAPGDCDGRSAESTIDIHAVFRGTQGDGQPWTSETNALQATVLTGCTG